jgi:pimeloyl-ACP methyl ester carboxylesterase
VDVGGGEVAYQVLGQGPQDMVYVAGRGHIDFIWEVPAWAAFLERLASFSRLILFDRRGTGVSAAVLDTAMPTWEEWADDLRAVLDAAGSERAVVFAEGDFGPTGLLITAIQPERVSALILANTTARYLRADDYPFGIPPEAVDEVVEMTRAGWGTPEVVAPTWPSLANDPEFLKWVAKYLGRAQLPRARQLSFATSSRAWTPGRHCCSSRYQPSFSTPRTTGSIAARRFVTFPTTSTGPSSWRYPGVTLALPPRPLRWRRLSSS